MTYPACVYMSLPAEIIAVRHNCYDLYWKSEWVAEFSCQEAAERYLEKEFIHVL
jgi:hypothetical protein